MKRDRVLIVDDEADIRELVEMTLTRMDIPCVAAENLNQAKQLLDKDNYFLCLSDMRLPDGDGFELVEYIQSAYPHIPVAVITAYGNVEGAVNTLKAGAFDYVSKPVNLKVLRSLVTTAQRLASESFSDSEQDNLIGESKAIAELREKIQKIARSQAPIFISGASGTGKELVAHRIHQQGPRAEKPFIPVNCGAIPSELMESEFFGHKKGSFTGAHSDKKGLFQSAEGGTLFLDEVADLPLHMQVKLLRAIQEKAVRPIGGEQEISIDVRILSASHKDLNALVTRGEFRQDLFYRINVIELAVPDLKDRDNDALLICDFILTRLAQERGCQKPSLTTASEQALAQYPFPGNVRELENILERAMTLCEASQIDVADLQLPEFLSQSEPQDESGSLDDILENQEKEMILVALERNKWNRTQTAKELGLSFRALRYRLKKWHIE